MADLSISIIAHDAASKVMDGVANTARGFGSALGGVASIAGGFVLGTAITEAPRFLFEAAKAAAEDEASVIKLQKAVENTGASWSSYQGKLGGVVDQGIKLGFADSKTRDALALLTAQTGSAEEAQERLALAQDFSRGTGTDLMVSAKLLGKVTDENVNVLGRYGISVEKGASSTELFGKIQEKFGGQAEAFANSTAGQMAQLELQMGELQESIGAAVLPLLVRLAGFATDVLVPAVQNGVVPAFEAIGRAVDGILSAIDPFIAIIGGLLSTFTASSADLEDRLYDLWDVINEVFGSEVATMVTDFVEDVVAGFDRMKQILVDTWTTIIQVFQQDWEPSDEIVTFTNDIGKLALVVRDQVLPALQQSFSAIRDVVVQSIQVAAQWWGQHSAEIQAVAERVFGAVRSIVETVVSAVVSLWQSEMSIIVTWVQANWPLIEATITKALNVVLATVQLVLGQIQTLWDRHGADISRIVSVLWDYIKTTIETAIRIVLNVITLALQVFTGDWQGAWDTIGKIVSEIWEANKRLIQTALTLIGTALKIALDAWLNDMRDKFGAIGSAIGTAWDGFKTAIGTALTAIGTAIGTAWDGIKTALGTVLTAIGTVIQTGWDGFKTVIGTAITGIGTVIQTGWDGFKTSISTALTGIGTAIQTGWDGFKTSIDTALTNIGTAITTFWNAVPGKISGLADQFATAARSLGSSLVSGMVSGLSNLGNDIAAAIRSALGGINIRVGPFTINASGFHIDAPTLPSFGVPSAERLVVAPGQQRASSGGGTTVVVNGVGLNEVASEVVRRLDRRAMLAGAY